jgi:hypothetical protein
MTDVPIHQHYYCTGGKSPATAGEVAQGVRRPGIPVGFDGGGWIDENIVL